MYADDTRYQPGFKKILADANVDNTVWKAQTVHLAPRTCINHTALQTCVKKKKKKVVVCFVCMYAYLNILGYTDWLFMFIQPLAVPVLMDLYSL